MPTTQEDYVKLLELYARVVEATKGLPIPPDKGWRAYPGPLSVKLFMHLASIFYLVSGTKLPGLAGVDIHFIDHPSIKVITRSAVETYLALHYLFVSPDSPQERDFRCKIWELSGLWERQRFTVTDPQNKAKLAAEKVQVDRLKTEIESHLLYQKLDKDERRKALRGEWKLKRQWVDLAKLAGFNETYFNMLYRYLCSYSHADSLSALQIDDAYDKRVQYDLAVTCLKVGLILMSELVFAFTKLFPETSATLDSHPDLKHKAEVWRLDAEEMARFYQGDA